jgi:hypothetical protein
VGASEQLVFDILARDAASASFLKVGQAAAGASGSVGDLNRRLTELNGRIASARVALSGNKEAQAALDKLQVSLTALGARTAKPNVQLSDTGFARAAADISAADVALDKLNKRWAPAKDGANAASAALSTLSYGWGRATGSVKLFGGALGAVPLLGSVGAVHLLTDAVVETAAVVGPAAIAFASFGIAAVPAVQAIGLQMKNLNTVATALGVTIPGLSGGFQKAAAAVQPQVYQLFGDALYIADQRGNAFVTLAHSAGTVVDQLGARFTAAVTSGNGFGVFLRNATSDLSKLGDIIGNVFGVFGNLLKVMPGYAQVLLTVADDFTKIAETASRVAAPVIGIGLAAHGAALYAGLLGTAVTFLATRGLNLVAGVALSAATGLGKLGLDGSLAARGLTGVADSAAAAAGLPLGWIGIAVAGFAALAFALGSAKDAAQTFNGTIQQELANVPLLKLQTTLTEAQASSSAQLAGANRQLSSALAQTGGQLTLLPSRFAIVNPLVGKAGQAAMEYGQGLAQIRQQGDLVNSRLAALSKAYGGNTAALGLLNAAGITSAQILDTNKSHWAATLIQVDATKRAYAEMGQQGGILGSDLNVINSLASDQYTTMNQLNSAWDTYLGNIGKLEQNSGSAITAFRQLKTDAAAAGASFTGVNAASITLQNDFNQNLFPSVQQVIDGMRSAGAPVKTLAQYMSTLLTPAVKDGALANAGMRTAIYDMAQEAGYSGPNKVGPLTAFINKNVTSLQNAGTAANNYAAALGRLPRQVSTTITETIAGKGNIAINASGAYIQGESGHITVGTAAGGFIKGGRPGHDSVHIMAMPGEVVVPTHMVRTGAVDHLRGRIPGFAAGGIVSPAATTSQAASVAGSMAGAFEKGATAQFVAGYRNALTSAFTPGPSSGGGISNWAPGASVSQWGAATSQALKMLALPQVYVLDVMYQMLTESGGNPYAVNKWDSNWAAGHPSVGLMQVIGGTYATYGAPRFGYPPPVAYGVSENPLANIYAALNYGAHNGRGFGTGPGQIGSGHGYDSGGFLPTGLSLAYNGTGLPEPVIPARGARGAAAAGGDGTTLGDVAGLLEDLIGVCSGAPGGFADALNGLARGAGYSAMYSVRP